MSFLNTHNIISASQFGFRPLHSTVHPMILFNNYVTKAFNNKKHTLAVFCDLRKAFDTVNHKVLLRKMEKIGIRNTELLWFRNYLSNRTQYVTISGVDSSEKIINIGVPQGSILGPLLFLIYINDLPNCTSLYCLLFADDTTLLDSDDDINTLFQRVNSELYNISCFFRKNKLALHPDKTKYILFSTHRDLELNHLSLSINNNNGDQDSEINKHYLKRIEGTINDPAIRFLGLYIDPQFSFNFHAQQIHKKISCALYFMRAAKHTLNDKALTSLYYSLIHSHLIYAIQAWSVCSSHWINSLFKLQKRAIRIIHNFKYNAHTESFFKKSNILPLPKAIEFFKLQFMQQYAQGFLPDAFNLVWTTNYINNPTPYLLRNSNDLYIPPARLTLTAKQPYHSFPRAWSDFNEFDIKIQREKTVFNKMLKKYFIEQLSDNYQCNRLLCPTCHLFLTSPLQ